MSITLHWPTIIGLLGTLLVLLAFFLLQAGKLQGNRPVYQLMNAVGAVAIIVSLLYEFNLAAMLLEIAWLAISIYGLVRGVRGPTLPL